MIASRDDDTRDVPSPLGRAAPGPKVDRDLVFAQVEQRLLGRALNPVRVGRFVVLHRVGHGGMGVVYAAHDPELERKVAVKLVDDGFGADAIPESHRELLREARAAAALSHPNVVTIYEVGVEANAVFLAMEFVDGPNLRRWLTMRKRSWREVVGMFVAAGRGLQAAHRGGLVHRDFKPDNVLIGDDGRPRVADFGLARPAKTPSTNPTDASLSDAGPDSTSGGRSFTAVAGTPRYMAPEQHVGRDIGPASDQFAFCVALYEALFDRHPFEAKSAAAIACRVMDEPPDPPGAASAKVPPGVIRLIMKGLGPRPEDRHASVELLIDGLARALSRRGRWVLGIGVASLAAVASVLGYQAAPPPIADPCIDASAPMAEHWNPAVSTALGEAFQTTERPGAQQSADLVRSKLDAYAEQWSAIRTQSCEATLEEGQRSDLLMELSYACLDRRLTGMATLVDRFAHADRSVVARAPRAVDELPALTPCEDRGALMSVRTNAFEGQSDRSASPEAYQEWTTLFDRLHRAEALRSLGQRDAAMELAQEVLARATADGLRGVEAAALGLRGRLRPSKSEAELARADLRRAAALALEADLDDVAIEALLGLSRLHRKHRDEADRAVVLLQLASGLARRSSLAVFDLRIASESARVLRLERDFEGARDRLEHAIEAAESLAPDHYAVLAARNDLAGNLVSLGQLAEAGMIFSDLLPKLIAARGPRHRSVGIVLTNLGVLAHNLGQADAALDHYGRALEFYESSDSTEGSESVRFRLGVLHREQRQLHQAKEQLRQTLSDRRDRLGLDHADLAEVLDALAEVERLQERWDPAMEHAQRALELLEAAHGRDYLDLRAPLVTLAKTEIDRGRLPQAELALRRAYELVYATEVDGLVRAEVCFDLARATVHDGAKHERALELALEASRLFMAAGERADPLRADVNAWLASRGE